MRKFSRVLLLVTVLLLLCFLVPVLLLASLEDQSYKKFLISSVDRFSDYTLTIDGPFKIERSLVAKLNASDIRLQSKINSNHLTLGQLALIVDLRRLTDSSLLIKSLILKDFQIDIADQSGDKEDPLLDFTRFFPTPVIEQAELTNISIHTATNDIHLEDLNVAGNEALIPVSVRGKGHFNANAFKIEGQMGPLNEIFDWPDPYPVDLKLDYFQSTLTLAGTIADPAKGKGLDLALTADTVELSTLLQGSNPPLGSLSVRGRISGRYTRPELSQLEFRLTSDTIDIKGRGSVDSLIDFENAELQINGQLNDPTVLDWLLDYDSGISQLTFSTGLSGDLQSIRLNQLNLDLITDQGAKASLSGNTDLVDAEFPLRDTQLALSIASAETKAVNPYIGDFLPELGTVKGTAKIVSTGNGLLFDDIAVTAGLKQKVHLQTAGQISLPGKAIDSLAFNLSVSLAARDVAELNPLLDLELPAIGPLSLKAKLQGTLQELILDQIDLQAGRPELVSVFANGNIAWRHLDQEKSTRHIKLHLHSSAPSVQKAYRVVGEEIPDLGPYEASMTVQGYGDHLTGRELKFRSGTKDTLLIECQGNIERISLNRFEHKGIHISGKLSADSTEQLSRFTYPDKIPDFGKVSGSFKIEGTSEALNIPQLQMVAGNRDNLFFSTQGSIASLPLTKEGVMQGVDILLEGQAPSTTSLSVFTPEDNKIPDLGPFRLNGNIKNGVQGINIDELQVAAGNPGQVTVKMYGDVDDIFGDQSLSVKVLFNESLLERLFNVDRLERQLPLQGSFLLTRSGNSLNIQELKILAQQSELFTVRLYGKISDLLSNDRISIHTDITIQDPTAAGRLFDVSLPDLKTVNISGLLKGNREDTAFEGNIRVGQTRLNNSIRFFKLDGQPSISGKISAMQINLLDFGFNREDSEQEKNGQKLFPDTPLPFSVLNSINLDLLISTGQVNGLIYPLEQTDIKLTLQQGNLKVSPARFMLPVGLIKAKAEIQTGTIPISSLEIEGNNIKLGTYAARENRNPPVTGNLGMRIKLNGKGHSLHEIASGLNGDIAFMLENGHIRKRNMDILFMNILGWLFSHGITEDELAISCGMLNYRVVDGIATSMSYIYGPKITARGKGSINLNKETIDALINIEQKRLFLNERVPIQVSGNLADPQIGLVSLSQTILKAGGYIFLPAVTLPVEFMGSFMDIIDDNTTVPGGCNEQLVR